MTGFASVVSDIGSASIGIEIRSVNSRFLDLSFRLPDEIRAAEPLLRERLSAAIQRGKVECRITLTRATPKDRPAAVNDGLLEQLLAAAARIQARAPAMAPLSVADLLRWPGLLQDGSDEALPEPQVLAAPFESALAEFQASRGREGAKLAALLVDRLDAIETHVQALQPKVPELIRLYSDKLGERLRSALVEAGAGTGISLDDVLNRVRQEVTVYAMKIDVAEELGRLASHASEMRRILSAGGAVGKRLDFLMQEFNREANTLGSKGLDLDVARIAVDLKILIEQMREQIQNLE